MVTRYLTALAIAGSLAAASVAGASPLERPSCGGETKKPDGTQNPPKSAIPSSSADTLCGGTKGGSTPPTEPPKS
jgi:hypothetical protein